MQCCAPGGCIPRMAQMKRRGCECGGVSASRGDTNHDLCRLGGRTGGWGSRAGVSRATGTPRPGFGVRLSAVLSYVCLVPLSAGNVTDEASLHGSSDSSYDRLGEGRALGCHHSWQWHSTRSMPCLRATPGFNPPFETSGRCISPLYLASIPTEIAPARKHSSAWKARSNRQTHAWLSIAGIHTQTSTHTHARLHLH